MSYINRHLSSLLKNQRLTPDENRARIMDCADRLFRQFGSDKTTVADMAKELKMSPANIYKFFASKDAIIQAGAERSLVQLKENLRRAAGSRKKAMTKLLDVVLEIYRFHQEYFRHERQIYKLVLSATEQNWSCVCSFREFLGEIIHGLIAEGSRTRELRVTNALATTAVLLDSFTWITNPILFPQLKAKEVESRARAQINFLERALK